jgi:hypothetical protein
MNRPSRILLSVGILVLLLLNGCSPQKYQGDGFSFTVPDGWKTMKEIWGKSFAQDTDYYGLGLTEQVMIQYPAQKAKGRAFFAVATAQLAEGEDLETRFNQTYDGIIPEIKDPVRQAFQLGDLSGYEITYKRPWGEPWWQFQDIWLEHDGVIYVLSAHASPQSFVDYAETFDQILDSFQIDN